MDTKTKSQALAEDVGALLRARTPLLWVVTREEARVERYLMEAAAWAGYTPRTWDCAQGFCDADGLRTRGSGDDHRDIGAALALIQQRATTGNLDRREEGERGAFILRDLAPWVAPGPIGITTCRQVRNLARLLPTSQRDRAQALIVLTPDANIPAELAGHATLIDWPLPDREEIAAILDAAVDLLPETDSKGQPLRDPVKASLKRESAIDAAVGLTGLEAQACFAKSLVTTRSIDPATIAAEKKRAVAKIGGLEWFDPLPGGLNAVGGLDVLKAHLVSRRMAWTPEARAYGLPAPRGDLLVGVPGCGKSLSAKAIATAWECPLLRVDLGAIKSKFVGDSENNLRKVFAIIAAIGRCVVWFDEIEKALAGAVNGAADGGVSTDALGAILTWMQERPGEAFVIATANDVTGLPPELLRRFDSTWFVDLPNSQERAQIAAAALRAHGRAMDEAACNAVAGATATYTGAEIAALVPAALYAAFADGQREPTQADLIAATKGRVPLAETMKEKLATLRAWGRERARAATTPEAAQGATQGGQIDL